MSLSLAEFLDDFVVPLLTGAVVRVQSPLSLRDRDRLLTQAGILGQAKVIEARQRRAERLVAVPDLGDVDGAELSLWVGLHNVLSFDHPDVERVWAREATWQRAQAETRKLLQIEVAADVREELARHGAVQAWLGLRRDDYTVLSSQEPQRFLGQVPSRVKVGWISQSSSEVQVETVQWITSPHHAAVTRLIPAALATSGISSLLYPALTEAQWTPLAHGVLLRDRALVRALCYAWARSSDWVELGASLFERALAGLGLRTLTAEGGASDRGDRSVPTPVEDIRDKTSALRRAIAGSEPVGDRDRWCALSELACALVHLHVLKVFEFDARVGLGPGVRRSATLAFLGLPLAVRAIEDWVGMPLAGADDLGLKNRWQEYLGHLADLVPRKSVDALTHVLLRAKQEGSPA